MRLIDRDYIDWRKPSLGSSTASSVLGISPRVSPYELWLMKIYHCEQQSQDWLKWREGGIGASEASTILDMNPWEKAHNLFLLKTKQLPPQGDNIHTRRGKRLEPEARALYEDLMGWTMEPCCGAHDEHDFIRASFDGLSKDHKLVLEIKCPSARWHNHTRDHGIPDWYYCQVQHQMLVAGANKCHFVSYLSSAPPGEHLLLVTVPRDDVFLAHLLEELRKFWAAVSTRTPYPEWVV